MAQQPNASAEAIDTGARERLGWLDAAKGVGIILVVIGHVWRGLETADLIGNKALYEAVDRAIYIFHMPLFFLIAGYLFAISRPQPFATFVARRAERLIWPLFLWTWIYFGVKIVLGGQANKPMGFDEFPFWPLPPRELFWFLWTLFLIQILAFPLQRAGSASRRVDPVLLGAIVAAFGVWMLWSMPERLMPWLLQVVLYMPHFLIGFVIYRLEWHRFSNLAVWIPVATFLVAEALVLSTTGDLSTTGARITDFVLSCVLALSVMLAVLIADREFGSSKCMAWLRATGAASMAIYVSHVIFTAATRIALKLVGINDVTLHLIIGTAIGIIAPIILYAMVRRLGMTRVAGF